jgi:hypothetical protein
MLTRRKFHPVLGDGSAGKPIDVAIEMYRSNGPTPKKLAGIEGGGSLPDARHFTHHLTASADRLLEERSPVKSTKVLADCLAVTEASEAAATYQQPDHHHD